MHDWCMVCVERTVGLEIVLDAPDGTPRLRGSCGILFRSVLKQCKRRYKIGAQFASNVP
jgi:chemotaxis response regulator CheB